MNFVEGVGVRVGEDAPLVVRRERRERVDGSSVGNRC